uniref:Uncharacterized protein n=1 Tax=Pseudictyota dubia TaxID=2749911 RepID=A0A7R9W8B8_9STRA|mmetsp:Transcript_39059/g.72159  ORF Transcript_39059/g.72159 Transcript_39059/m.72159 type:complete len:116 (+) Transcript_39059:197-544(+)
MTVKRVLLRLDLRAEGEDREGTGPAVRREGRQVGGGMSRGGLANLSCDSCKPLLLATRQGGHRLTSSSISDGNTKEATARRRREMRGGKEGGRSWFAVDNSGGGGGRRIAIGVAH